MIYNLKILYAYRNEVYHDNPDYKKKKKKMKKT